MDLDRTGSYPPADTVPDSRSQHGSGTGSAGGYITVRVGRKDSERCHFTYYAKIFFLYGHDVYRSSDISSGIFLIIWAWPLYFAMELTTVTRRNRVRYYRVFHNQGRLFIN